VELSNKAEKEALIKSLNYEIEELKSSLEHHQSELKDKNESVEILTSQLENVEFAKTETELNFNELQQRIYKLETELSEVILVKSTLQTELEKKNKNIKDLESNFNKYGELKTAFDVELNGKEEQEKAVQALKFEITDLELKLKRYENELTEKEETITSLTDKINHSETKRTEAISSSDTLLERIETLEVELTELREIKETYESQINEYKANLHGNNSQQFDLVKEYEDKIAKLQNDINKLSEAGNNITDIIEEKNSIIEEQGKRLSQVKLEKTEREIEFIKLKEQLEDYKNEVDKLSSSRNQYMVEANNSFEEIEKLNDQIYQIQKEIKEKENNDSKLKEVIQTQEKRITVLQSQINKIQTSEAPIQAKESKKVEKGLISESFEFTGNNVINFDDPDSLGKLDLSFSSSPNEEKNTDIKVNDFYETDNEIELKSAPLSESQELQNINKVFDLGSVNKEDGYNQHDEFAHLLYGNISVVSVKLPRATMDIASKFKDYLNNLIDNENSKIVIDLSECEFVDSTVLGVLVSSLKKAMTKEGDLRIVWGDNTESSMFYITRMDKVFKLFDNLEDAIQSFF
jgi:anti-anti-sigma factor